MKQYKFTPEQVTEMVEMDDRGATRVSIAKKYGISSAMITQIMKNPEYYRNRLTVSVRQRYIKGLDEADKLRGAKCSACGIYYTRPHGHPVVCECCRNHSKQFETFKVATIPTL